LNIVKELEEFSDFRKLVSANYGAFPIVLLQRAHACFKKNLVPFFKPVAGLLQLALLNTKGGYGFVGKFLHRWRGLVGG